MLYVCVCSGGIVNFSSAKYVKGSGRKRESDREREAIATTTYRIELENVLKEPRWFVAELERESATAAALFEVKSNQNIAN